MTLKEFQMKYHEYETFCLEDAETERDNVNKELEGDQCVVVALDIIRTKYCLMLKQSANFLRDNNII